MVAREQEIEEARMILLNAEARLQNLKKRVDTFESVVGKDDSIRKHEIMIGFIIGVLIFQILVLWFS